MSSQQSNSHWSCSYNGNRLIYNGTIARGGNIRSIRSDSGAHFLGTGNEIKKTFQKMNHIKIKHFLQENGADQLVWTRNTATGTHMDGLREQAINSAGNILSSLLKTHRTNLNGRLFHTDYRRQSST